jgi:hypothetical protein
VAGVETPFGALGKEASGCVPVWDQEMVLTAMSGWEPSGEVPWIPPSGPLICCPKLSRGSTTALRTSVSDEWSLTECE